MGQVAAVDRLEPELKDAPVEDGQHEQDRQPARPAVDRRNPGRRRPGQLAEDPGRRQELAAGKADGDHREPGHQMELAREEEREVALALLAAAREKPGRERDRREDGSRGDQPAD